MTNNEEVEKKDLLRRLYDGEESFEDIANSIIRERDIAVLEARIAENHNSPCTDAEWHRRRKDYLLIELSALKKESEKRHKINRTKNFYQLT